MSDPTNEPSAEPPLPDDLAFQTRSGTVVCSNEGFTEGWFAPPVADPEGPAPAVYWHTGPELLTLLRPGSVLKPVSRNPVEALLFGDGHELRVRLTFEPGMCPSAPFTMAETGKPIRRFRTLPDAILAAEAAMKLRRVLDALGRGLHENQAEAEATPRMMLSRGEPRPEACSPVSLDETRGRFGRTYQVWAGDPRTKTLAGGA